MSIASVLPLSMSIGSGTVLQNCASVCPLLFPLPRVLLVVLVFSAIVGLSDSVEYSSLPSLFYRCTTFGLRGCRVLVTLSVDELIYAMDLLLYTLFREGVDYSSPSFVDCGPMLLVSLSLECSRKDFYILQNNSTLWPVTLRMALFLLYFN